MSVPIAGWYKNSAGEQQWWDGRQWGPTAPNQTRSKASSHAAPVQATTPVRQIIYVKPSKSVGGAYLLLIFLGNFGAHRFYVNSPGVAILFILSWAISVLGIFGNVEFGQDPIFTASLIAYLALFLFDLFTLGGKVRRHNSRQQFTL